jgi:cobalt-zinc-cadmium resistance protein CzcA
MMLSRLIQFALAQRLLILLALLVLVATGWRAFQNLPIDAYPDVSTTQVKLILKAPGLTPEEVENRITQPIETEMLGLPRQSMLRSVSKYGLADITVGFAEGTDIYWARQQVAERLSGILGSLPAGTTGGLAPITTPLGEMFMFTVEGGGLSLMERRSLLDWVIRPALRTVPGVADVNVLGGELRSFEVVPDLTRMAATGISMDALMTALAINNRNDGAGRLEEGGEVLLVRAEGRIRDLADLAAIVVVNREGVPVRVGDIAKLRIGAITRLGAVTENGRGETVEGLVLGLRGANARQVVQGVEARLAELRPTLPKGVQIRAFYNRADLVNKAVHTVSKALTEAVVLVLLLLLVFLGNLRAALSAALILPLAALMTFLLMQYFGLSANLMSLGGLAIAIGMHRGCRGGGGGEYRPASGPRSLCGQAPASAPHLSGGARGGDPHQRRRAHHHYRLFALADPAGPGGQALHPGGADHHLCPGGLPAAVAYGHSRAQCVSAEKSET